MSTKSYLRALVCAQVAVLVTSCSSDATGPQRPASQPPDSSAVILPSASHATIQELLITISSPDSSGQTGDPPTYTLALPDTVTVGTAMEKTIQFGNTPFAPIAAVDYGDGGGPQSLTVSGGQQLIDPTTGTATTQPYTVTLNHTYTRPGTFVVVMGASDTEGTNVQADTVYVVFPADNSHPPVVSLLGDTSAVAEQAYTLGVDISDPDAAGTYSASVDWGDGTTTSQAMSVNKSVDFSHTWQSAGTYQVRVIGSDGIETDTVSRPVTVTAGGPTPPVIHILQGDSTAIASTAFTKLPYTFSFDWADTDPDDTFAISLNWGDGSAAVTTTTTDTTTISRTHEWQSLGTDTITAIVSDGVTADTVTHVVRVDDTPFKVVTDSVFTGPDGYPLAMVPAGFVVHIDDPDPSGNYSMSIDWGDGTTESRSVQNEEQEKFLHTYQAAGVDTLTAIFSDGIWADTIVQANKIGPAPCGPGTYTDTSGKCVQAPVGTYTDVYGATRATPCAAGTYQPSTGQTSCLPAPAGSYVSQVGAIAATKCVVGTYQPGTGATSCIAAEPGHFVDTVGATSATACAAGTFQASSGATSCEEAPAGSYVATTGATSATPCQAGTFQPDAGTTSCTSADPGHFVAQAGSTAEAPCQVGTFASGSGSKYCDPAPVGTFVATIGASAATPCAVGTYQDQVGQTSCKDAPAGTFVNVQGASAATPCTVGTYQPQAGQSACIPAEPGSYVSITGAEAATPCPAGTYQPESGQASCIQAPVGSYVEVTGATEATACPSGTTTLATGSTSVSDCITYGQVAQDRIQQAVSTGTIYPAAGGKGAQQTFDHWITDLHRSANFLTGPQHQAGCVGVRNLYLRADGKPSPKDAITGPGRAGVAATLVWLMQEDSCGS